MTQELDQSAPCAKCARMLMKWTMVDLMQYRLRSYWIPLGDHPGLLTPGPYCFPCWQEITQGAGKDKVVL